MLLQNTINMSTFLKKVIFRKRYVDICSKKIYNKGKEKGEFI